MKRGEDGKVREIIVEHATSSSDKIHPIHWVPVIDGKDPLKVEVREYERLFLSEDPVAKHGKEWLSDLNPDSLKIRTAFIDPSVLELSVLDRVQFERLGFYCVDLDTDLVAKKFVFNKTVGLKESTWKKNK